MFEGQKVIDVHGHISTPREFNAFGKLLTTSPNPRRERLDMPDELLDTRIGPHVKGLDGRNIDVQILSPRPVGMMHFEGLAVQEVWCRTTNDVIAQACRMYPDRFVGMAQLPQNVALDTSNCVPELERCVDEYGFVGAIVNPDPGGLRDAPGLDQEYWYPLYEKAQELDVPLMIHTSHTRDPRVVGIPHNYQLNSVWEEYLASQLYVHTDVFEVFPRLKVVIPHGGGAPSRHYNQDQREGPTREQIRTRFANNLFYDTCGYDQDWMAATIRQKGVDMMVFGTEAGALSSPDAPRYEGRSEAPSPITGKRPDDVLALIDSLPFLSSQDKIKIVNTNVRTVYGRLDV